MQNFQKTAGSGDFLTHQNEETSRRKRSKKTQHLRTRMASPEFETSTERALY